MKIQYKLFLFLFGFSVILITGLVYVMQWSIDRGMVDYVNTKEVKLLQPVVQQLAKEYQINNNWQSIAEKHQKFHHLITRVLHSNKPSTLKRIPRNDFPPKPFDRPNSQPPRGNRPPPPMEEEAFYALLDANKELIAGKYLPNIDYSETPIIVDNKTIGYLAISKRNRLTEGYELDFINQQHDDLWIIAFVTLGIVMLITFPLSQHVVQPIKKITQGIHQLTLGNYDQTINLKRKDELGQLSTDYNNLANTLDENNKARKRWLANISHELRTPVAILRGELEAMLDNVRPLTKENITSANDEVKHLQRIIDDLHQLTRAQIGSFTYHKEQINLTLLLSKELDKYRAMLADANITLMTSITEEVVWVNIDVTRISQLFENIISNAIKYANASQLKISLNSQHQPNQVAVISIEDNGVGVDEVHLPHLFEYLYRVDDARNRNDGGAGLGLSICKQIISDHQGSVVANHSTLGGLAITISIPTTKEG